MREFIAAKVCARAALFLTVIVAGGLVAFAYCVKELAGFGLTDSVIRLALWLGAVSIYSLFWFALAVRVNTFGKSSETNATILACAWLCLVVILPTLVNQLATTLYPAPSRMMLKVAQREAFAEAEANLDETKRKFYIDHVEMVPEEDMTEYTLSFLARQEAMDKAVEPVHQRFEQQKERQEALVGKFQFASPAIIAQSALNDISGTGTARFADYLQQVYAFHAERKTYFLPKYIRRQILTSSMYDEFPQFVYGREDVTDLVRRVLMPLLILLVLSIALYPRRVSVADKLSSREVTPGDATDTRLGDPGIRSS